MADLGDLIAAIFAVIVFIIGFWLAIPGPAELGVLILQGMSPLATTAIGQEALSNGILALQILGVAMIVGDIIVILLLFRRAAD